MKTIMVTALIISLPLTSCRIRTASANSAASTKQQPEAFLGLGLCEIQGDLPAQMTFDRIQITLPYATPGLQPRDVVKNTARIEMLGQAGLKIDEGLDLYNRAGQIAMVSGALVGPAPEYRVEFAIKISLNDTAEAGFAVVDGVYGSTTAPVSCSWTERTDLNIAETSNGGIDSATLNPNPEERFQLVSTTDSPLLCR